MVAIHVDGIVCHICRMILNWHVVFLRISESEKGWQSRDLKLYRITVHLDWSVVRVLAPGIGKNGLFQSFWGRTQSKIGWVGRHDFRVQLKGKCCVFLILIHQQLGNPMKPVLIWGPLPRRYLGTCADHRGFPWWRHRWGRLDFSDSLGLIHRFTWNTWILLL